MSRTRGRVGSPVSTRRCAPRRARLQPRPVQLGDHPAPERRRRLLQAAAIVAVPSLLWIAGAALVTGEYDVTKALMLNNLLALTRGPRTGSTTRGRRVGHPARVVRRRLVGVEAHDVVTSLRTATVPRAHRDPSPRSRRPLESGWLPVTQKASPAGSRRTCQPRPAPTSSAPRSTRRRTSAGASSVPWSRWARTTPSSSSSRWNSSWSGESASCHLPANSAAGEETQRPPSRVPPELDLGPVHAAWGVHAHLDHPRTVSVRPGARCRHRILVGRDHAPGQTARGQERAPAVVLGHQVGSQEDSMVHCRVGVLRLHVEVHPGRAVDLLEVDVRRTVVRLEAAQLRVTRPRFTGRPSQDAAPEPRRRVEACSRHVEDRVEPGHGCAVPRVARGMRPRTDVCRRRRWEPARRQAQPNRGGP